MKLATPFITSLLFVGTMAPFISPRTASADISLSFQYFNDNLSPYGEWVTVGDYGPCWHPLSVAPDWSPYQNGYWAHTNAGWTWISDEPFGDTVYHYGRWMLIHDYGWAWVPGYEWAPAWVSWRTSDDYVGWAPLPPDARWDRSTGFSTWTDQAYGIGPRYYRFCSVRDFGARRMRDVCLPWRDNYNFFDTTVNVTSIYYDDDARRIYSSGPSLRYFENRTREPIPRLRLVESSDAPRSSVLRDEYHFRRPPVAPNVFQGRDQFRPSGKRQFDRSEVDRGWSGARDNEQRQKLQRFIAKQNGGRHPDNSPARALPEVLGGLILQQADRALQKHGDRRDGREEDRDLRDKSKDHDRGRDDGSRQFDKAPKPKPQPRVQDAPPRPVQVKPPAAKPRDKAPPPSKPSVTNKPGPRPESAKPKDNRPDSKPDKGKPNAKPQGESSKSKKDKDDDRHGDKKKDNKR